MIIAQNISRLTIHFRFVLSLMAFFFRRFDITEKQIFQLGSERQIDMHFVKILYYHSYFKIKVKYH